MAATVTYPFPQLAQESIGSLHGSLIRVTLATNDYVTNGIDCSSLIPSGDVIGADVLNSTGVGSLTQVPTFNATNKKLVLLKGTAGVNAEVSNGSSDAQVVDIMVYTA
jgi:hypothetical protein